MNESSPSDVEILQEHCLNGFDLGQEEYKNSIFRRNHSQTMSRQEESVELMGVF